MGIPPEVMSAAVAARDTPSKSGWQKCSLSFLDAYWGAPIGTKGGFTRRINRSLTSVAYEAYKTDRNRTRDFIREGWQNRSGAQYPAYRNSVALNAAVGLSSIDYRDGLPEEGASLMRVLLTFYGLEGVVRPHLILFNGLAHIALGRAFATENLILSKRTRKLKSVEDVLSDYQVLLGSLASSTRTKGAVGGLKTLLSSISPKTGIRQRRIGLVELRNMTAHHDFALDSDGSLVIGYNTFSRAGGKARRISSATLDSNFDRLKGLDTMFTSWSAFLRIMATSTRPR